MISIYSMKFSLRQLVGIIIWWTEGTKAYKEKRWGSWIYPVDVTNTNPDIIKSFLNFLRKDIGINELRLKLQLQIHDGDNQEEIEDYWSKATKIPRERFTKTIIRPKGNKVGKSIGTCKVRYSDKPTHLKLESLLENVLLCLDSKKRTGHSVTANILALGASDSGFESQCPEEILVK